MRSLNSLKRMIGVKDENSALIRSRLKEDANQAGSVALLGLIIMVVLLFAAIGTLSYIQANYQSTSAIGQQASALGIAEAGVEHVLWRLNKTDDGSGHYGDTWSVSSDEQDIAFGNGTYYMAALERGTDGHVADIRMQGWIPSRSASNAQESEVYAVLKYTAGTGGYFPMSVMANNSLTFNSGNKCNTNSCDFKTNPNSFLSHGHVGCRNTSNRSCNIAGGPTFHGYLYYPTGFKGSYKIPSGWSSCTGGSPQPYAFNALPAINIPSDAIDIYAVQDGPYAYKPNGYTPYKDSDGYYFIKFQKYDGTYLGDSNNLASDGLPYIPAGNYHIHGTPYWVNGSWGYKSFWSQSGHCIRFGTDKETKLYIDGDCNFYNCKIFTADQLPAKLTFYCGSNCQNVGFNSDSYHICKVYGGVYAPSASSTFSNYSYLYGSIITNDATFSDNGQVIFDEALNGMGNSGGTYAVSTWSQTK